ncbi:GNAT family N-acetyltransferase [Priestia endophytica]|uniref:Acetyltransferase (GNAT) domain-containing protein n=1 Tax=Priestia endophytica DSM 13796 TaxID=1121089 RepID=A0A1I5X1I0_9BACI|nr:GNAT family N-acetyltransferase [Priestia endophytica]KYG36398.1 GCN5 family acetyltransferase [Priestia endophytica]SFQ25798.1 Acetyltransferase (GNAT) domain-containing protein [Priestia endophytica DSM 13796]
MKKVDVSSRLIISKLSELEKEETRALLIASYKQYEKDYEDKSVWEEYKANISSSLEKQEVEQILVAKQGKEIVGTLQLFCNGKTAYNKLELEIFDPIVRLLAVHPKARGRGVAKALLKESLLYAKTKGARCLYLHSGEMMKEAISLYERLGFKRDYSKEFSNQDILVKCCRYDLYKGGEENECQSS